jgi:predicted transcriptional regulator
MAVKRFQVGKFYAMLDQKRIALGMDWKDVAEATGIPASTLTRMGQGKKPDADNLATLCWWTGFNLRAFSVLR